MLDTLTADYRSNLDNEQRLLVLLDKMLELGDPLAPIRRRELMNKASWRFEPEQRQLLERLEPVTAGFKLFRGAPQEVTLKRLTADGYAELVGLPEWKTVESIHFGSGVPRDPNPLPAAQIAQLLAHPVMHAVRHVSGLDRGSFAQLGSQSAVSHFSQVDVDAAGAVALPRQLGGLPGLRRLGISFCTTADIETLVSAEWAAKLEALHVGTDSHEHVSAILRRFLELPEPFGVLTVGENIRALREDVWELTVDLTRGADLAATIGVLTNAVGPEHRLLVKLTRENYRDVDIINLIERYGWQFDIDGRRFEF